MKNRLKHICTGFLLTAVSVFLMPAGVLAAQQVQTVEAQAVPSADGTGAYIIPGIDQSYYNYSQSDRQRSKRMVLPEKYDLRELGVVNEVKNQGHFGMCWAFANLTAVEGNQMMQQKLQGDTTLSADYSPRHLTWFAYQYANDGNGGQEGVISLYGCPWNQGGSRNMAVGQMAAWSGPELEEKAPFSWNESTWSVDSTLYSDSYVHIQNVDYLPGTAVFTDNVYSFDRQACDTIKSALMQNGIVDVSINADGLEDGNRYVDQPDSVNHEVSIVGWDDAYPKENFKEGSTPPQDGAWIVRNSWGSDWAYDGYFYLSYYDQTVGYFTSYQSELPDEEGNYIYDNNYQYDFLGLKSAISLVPTEQKSRIANIFEAEGEEWLKGVSVYSMEPNSEADIKIYKVTDRTNPEKGELLWESSSIIPYGGYHTVELDKPVKLQKGELFSVVEQIKGSKGYSISTELANNEPLNGFDKNGDSVSEGKQEKVTIQKGESFVDMGGGWSDLKKNPYGFSGITSGNVLIKAFTVNQSEEETVVPQLTSMQLNCWNNYMDELDTLIVDSFQNEVNEITLPESCALVTLAPSFDSEGGKELLIDGQSYPVNFQMPRSLLEGKTVTLVSRARGDVSKYQSWSFLFTVPDTVLGDEELSLTDSSSVLPSIEFQADLCDEQDALYDAVRTKLTEEGKTSRLALYSLSAVYKDKDFTLEDQKTVQLKIQYPEGLSDESVILYRIREKDGELHLDELARGEGGYVKAWVHDISGVYYAVAADKVQQTKVPAIPVVRERTDTSISIAVVDGEEYSIDGGKTFSPDGLFSGLKQGTQYQIVSRMAETDEMSAGAAGPVLTVSTKQRLADPSAPTAALRGDTWIEAEAAQGQEYAIRPHRDGTDSESVQWQDSARFENLIPGSTYDIGTRIKETGDVMVGLPVWNLNVSTKYSAPQAPEAPTLMYVSEYSIILTQVSGQEYSIDEGVTWQASGTFSGLTENTSYYIYTRIAETDDTMSSPLSEAAEVKTIRGDSLLPQPLVILRTDTRIQLQEKSGQEYSLRDSQTGTFTEWQTSGVFQGLQSGRKYMAVARERLSEDTQGYQLSRELLVSTKFQAPAAPGAPQVLSRTDRTIVIQSRSGEVYSIDGGNTWQTGGSFENLSSGTAYVIYAKIQETDDTMESSRSEAASVVTKKSGITLTAPELLSKTESTIIVKEQDGLLYSIDNGLNWQKSGTFTNLKPASVYHVISSRPETEDTMGTASSLSLSVTTEKGTVKEPEAPVSTAISESSITVKVIPGQEYSINGGKTWQTSGVFGGLKEKTKYSIVTRVKETAVNKASGASRALTVSTKEKQTPVAVKYKVTFHPNGGTVSTKSKTVIYGSSYGKLPSPKRKNYSFQGWYTSKSYTKKVTSASKVAIKKNQTLYARWTKVSTSKMGRVTLTSSKKGYMTVSYKAMKGVAGYQIVYGTNSAITKGRKTINTTALKKSFSKLKKGKVYYVKVRAYKKDSAGNKIYGKYNTTAKVKIKK